MTTLHKNTRIPRHEQGHVHPVQAINNGLEASPPSPNRYFSVVARVSVHATPLSHLLQEGHQIVCQPVRLAFPLEVRRGHVLAVVEPEPAAELNSQCRADQADATGPRRTRVVNPPGRRQHAQAARIERSRQQRPGVVVGQAEPRRAVARCQHVREDDGHVVAADVVALTAARGDEGEFRVPARVV